MVLSEVIESIGKIIDGPGVDGIERPTESVKRLSGRWSRRWPGSCWTARRSRLQGGIASRYGAGGLGASRRYAGVMRPCRGEAREVLGPRAVPADSRRFSQAVTVISWISSAG